MKREDKFILRWAKRYRAYCELGGKCNNCGETDIFILDFHHKNPKEKEYGISQFSAHAPWGKIKKELDKCILLCRNCHGKHHIFETEQVFKKNFDLIKLKSKEVDKVTKNKLDKNKIYHLLIGGKSLNEVARLLNKDVSTIRFVAKKISQEKGVKLFKTRVEHNSKKEKINKEQLIKFLKEGLSVELMAKHFNCAKSTLYGRIKKIKNNETFF